MQQTADDFISENFGEIPLPRNWAMLTEPERLDWITGYILEKDRRQSGVTSHQALLDTGILSKDQYRRRLNREVYSRYPNLNKLIQRVGVGVFGRVYSPLHHTPTDPEKYLGVDKKMVSQYEVRGWTHE